jgi:hypothetical protein
VKLRLKISFSVNGQAIDEMISFDSFDSSLWS